MAARLPELRRAALEKAKDEELLPLVVEVVVVLDVSY